MKQIVAFLERAHRSLEILGTRLTSSQQTVPRSYSEHQIVIQDSDSVKDIDMSSANSTQVDYSAFRDFTW